MLETIPVGLLNGIGVVGVVFLVGWWIGTGRWVPRKTHEDAIKDRDGWRAECMEWRSAAAIKDEQIAVKDAQLRQLSEVGHTVNVILNAIQSGAR